MCLHNTGRNRVSDAWPRLEAQDPYVALDEYVVMVVPSPSWNTAYAHCSPQGRGSRTTPTGAACYRTANVSISDILPTAF